MSRRDFGRRVGIAAAITLSSSSLLVCNTASVRESKPGDKTPDKAGGDLTPDQAQDVEARLANVIRKYGNRLSEEQRQHLRRILTYNERMLVSIRTFPLQNGDPPASVLKISLVGQAEPAKPRSVAAEGYPTTWGARPYAKQKFDFNATIIERLNNAGAVLIGKTAMIELAGGLGYSNWCRLAERPVQEPLEHRLLDLRLVERFRCNRFGGPCALGTWLGHARIHNLSLGVVRRFWHEAELWAG
jgi:hypothetical protein